MATPINNTSLKLPEQERLPMSTFDKALPYIGIAQIAICTLAGVSGSAKGRDMLDRSIIAGAVSGTLVIGSTSFLCDAYDTLKDGASLEKIREVASTAGLHLAFGALSGVFYGVIFGPPTGLFAAVIANKL